MKRVSLSLVFTLITLFSLYPQEDPVALAVLDRFAAAAKTAPSVSMEFTMITSDAMENRKDTLEGKVVMAGDSYRLTLPESITWFNGTDNWNYMPSVKEVTITRHPDEEQSFFSKPSMLFEMYRKDFRARHTESTSTTEIIDLFPADVKSELIRVRLTIGKKTSDLIAAEYRTRNGITVTIEVKEYNLRFKPDNKYFDFNPANHKGVEIIDMR